MYWQPYTLSMPMANSEIDTITSIDVLASSDVSNCPMHRKTYLLIASMFPNNCREQLVEIALSFSWRSSVKSTGCDVYDLAFCRCNALSSCVRFFVPSKISHEDTSNAILDSFRCWAFARYSDQPYPKRSHSSLTIGCPQQTSANQQLDWIRHFCSASIASIQWHSCTVWRHLRRRHSPMV